MNQTNFDKALPESIAQLDITETELLLTMGEVVLRGIANQDITPAQGKVVLDLVEEKHKKD